MGRLNRPGLMVYGGSIRAGSCEGAPPIDIVDAFQSYGKYLQDGKTPQAERERYNTVRHACPGAGACGGVSAVSCSARPTPYSQKLRCTLLILWPAQLKLLA